jgi:hypothetical protein
MSQNFDPTGETDVKSLMAEWLAGDPEGKMDDALDENPEIVWRTILEILQRDLTDDERALLAAGPLEGLFRLHGSNFIERAEQEAKVNPRFIYLLGGVWHSDIPQEIWQRVERMRREVW